MYETAHLEGGYITRKKSCYMHLLKTYKVRDIFSVPKNRRQSNTVAFVE
jgi:hypothetical protein